MIKILNKGILSGIGYMSNFGKKELIWQEVADEYNGIFKKKFTTDGLYEIHNISFPYKKWDIQFSVSDTKPIKVCISFTAIANFNFILSWEDFIEKLIKKFCKRETETGNKQFDNKYLIRSNNPEIVKQILTTDIQLILLKYNIHSISFQSNLKHKKAELISIIQRQVENKQMINELIKMFKSLIDKLSNTKIIE